jgi:protein phosphatase
MPWVIAAATDTGRRRTRNEDAVFARCLDADAAGDAAAVLAVADGMGGLEGGEVASRLAIRAVGELRVTRSAAAAHSLHDAWLEALARLPADCEARLRAEAARSTALTAMGTTLTVLVLSGSTALFAHVGDSRAYLHRDGALIQLTTDHNAAWETASGELVGDGRIAHERHALTRWLAADGGGVDAEIGSLGALPRDLFLLCTDGLTTMLDDEAIGAVLEQYAPGEPGDVARTPAALIERANAAGGADNISVAVAWLFEA